MKRATIEHEEKSSSLLGRKKSWTVVHIHRTPDRQVFSFSLLLREEERDVDFSL